MKHLFVYILATCLLLLTACGPAQPGAEGSVIYYVDSNQGDDGNPGTSSEQAWATLERVNREQFGPGDRILFRAGSLYRGQLSPQGSGEAGAAIIVDVYDGDEKARIDAEGRFNEALLLRNQDFWEINNLELTNEGPERARSRYGIRLSAWDYGTMRHIHLKNLFVHDVNGSLVKEDVGEGHGILWENGGDTTPSRFDDLLIEGCHLLRTDRNGICGYSENSSRDKWLPSLNVVIRNNLLEDIGGDGIKLWGCDGALVEGNRLDGARRRAEDYAAGIWPWSSDNSVFQFNEVSGVKGTKDGQAFDSDGNCRNTLFQYNYSHENDGGFMLICSSGNWQAPTMLPNTGTIVRYNISQNDGARTFHMAGPVQKTEIYNNVFYIGEDLDLNVFLFTDWDGWARETLVANNIIYAEGQARYGHGVERIPDGTFGSAPGFGLSEGNRFENNLYFGNHHNRPPDPKALTADPQLRNPGAGADGFDSLEGYSLEAGSPAIDAGMSIAEGSLFDFWKTPVPQGPSPDIGVQEFESP